MGFVDDGSTDNTKELAKIFKNNARFSVKYVYQKNHGKHVAINVGGVISSAKWFFIVDSDDYLTDDAIERVLLYCATIEEKTAFAGVVGLRKKQNGEIWMEWPDGRKGETNILEKEYIDATSFEYRYKYKVAGDRAEVIRSELLRRYPFPVFEEERFLSESYLWDSVARDGYKFRWFNEAIYVTKYREDGLSKNHKSYDAKSAHGIMACNNLKLSCRKIPIKVRLKSGYNYYRYGRLLGISFAELFIKCNDKLLSAFGIPMAIMRK